MVMTRDHTNLSRVPVKRAHEFDLLYFIGDKAQGDIAMKQTIVGSLKCGGARFLNVSGVTDMSDVRVTNTVTMKGRVNRKK